MLLLVRARKFREHIYKSEESERSLNIHITTKKFFKRSLELNASKTYSCNMVLKRNFNILSLCARKHGISMILKSCPC